MAMKPTKPTNRQPGLGHKPQHTPVERPTPIKSKMPDRGPALVRRRPPDTNWGRK